MANQLLLPEICKKNNLIYRRLALNSYDRDAGGTTQRGTIRTPREWAKVVSVIPRKVVVPIASGGSINTARLRLTANGTSLNNTYSVTGEYALSVHVALDYSMQVNMSQEWPIGTEPILMEHQVATTGGLRLGTQWDYEWVQVDGSPYTPPANWDLELTLVTMCCEPHKLKPCQMHAAK